MCKELCAEDGSLMTRCTDCAVYLCHDPQVHDMRMVERPAVTGQVNLCGPCYDERQEAEA